MHTIRLRKPWEKSRIGSDRVDRIDIPETGSETSDSRVCYRRRFNLPTGLDESSSVRLRISGWSGRLDSIRLNGHELDHSEGQVDTEVAGLLRAGNEIELHLQSTPDQPARLSGEVWLAIA